MLAKSDRPIIDVIKRLSNYGVEAAFIVPTATGLEKSILDAVDSVRFDIVSDLGMKNKGIDELNFFIDEYTQAIVRSTMNGKIIPLPI